MDPENIREWYKIVDYDKGKYKTLFHGIKRCRVLKFGEWLESETKLVTDGSRNRSYWSGWHITPEYEDCVKYMKNFRHTSKKRILRCQAKDIWSKPDARGNIFLAKYILIESEVFNTENDFISIIGLSLNSD